MSIRMIAPVVALVLSACPALTDERAQVESVPPVATVAASQAPHLEAQRVAQGGHDLHLSLGAVAMHQELAARNGGRLVVSDRARALLADFAN